MRRFFGAFPLASFVAVIAGLATPSTAQTGPAGQAFGVPSSPHPERNVSATGKVMPPATGRATGSEVGSVPSSVAVEMMKAQKAAEMRNKAWDSKMRKTMGSICSGC